MNQTFVLCANAVTCSAVAVAELVVGVKWMHKCEPLHKLGMLLCGVAESIIALWQVTMAIVVMFGLQRSFYEADFVQTLINNLNILCWVQNLVIAGVIYDHFRKL